VRDWLGAFSSAIQTGKNNASKRATQGTRAAQDQNAMIYRQPLSIPQHLTSPPPRT